ncbi:MAG: TonB-dependent receptor plug domain-containing protein, partial [Gammaproteobacteria bacterium]
MRTRKWVHAAEAVLALAAPSLLEAQHVVEEVRVVATPHDLSPADVAQSVTVLADERLRRSLRPTLGETLASELGVSSTYHGSGASRPVIRGLAGARVKVMEDGIDALDVSSISADHAVGVDPAAARQIEIFRGPTTLLYGSGAVGGVVNTVTNRLPSTVPDEGLGAALELEADSASHRRRAAFAIDGGRERIAWHVDAARQRADDYEIPGTAVRGTDPDDFDAASGVVPNSGFDTTSGAMGFAWLAERSTLGLAVRRLASEYGVPHVHADHEHAEEVGVRIDLDATRVDLRGDWLAFERFPGIEFRLGLGDYEHLEIEGDEIATRFRNDALEGRVEVVHAPWGTWRGAFGAQVGGRELEA